MTPSDRVEAFKRAYECAGGLHWTYNGRQPAAAAWIAGRIQSLPDPPREAPLMLCEWIRACPVAAMRRERLERAADLAQSGAAYHHEIYSREDLQELALILHDRQNPP